MAGSILSPGTDALVQLGNKTNVFGEQQLLPPTTSITQQKARPTQDSLEFQHFHSLMASGREMDALDYARRQGFTDAEIAAYTKNNYGNKYKTDDISAFIGRMTPEAIEAEKRRLANEEAQKVIKDNVATDPSLDEARNLATGAYNDAGYTPVQLDLTQFAMPQQAAMPQFARAQLPTAQTPQLSAEQMQAMLQDYLHGDGKFVQNMQQTNNAGMYDSVTRTQIANDLVARAGRQVQMANADLRGKYDATMAQIQGTAAINEADMYNRGLLQQQQTANQMAATNFNAQLQAAIANNNALNEARKAEAINKANIALKGADILGTVGTNTVNLTNKTAGADTFKAAPIVVTPATETITTDNSARNAQIKDENAIDNTVAGIGVDLLDKLLPSVSGAVTTGLGNIGKLFGGSTDNTFVPGTLDTSGVDSKLDSTVSTDELTNYFTGGAEDAEYDEFGNIVV